MRSYEIRHFIEDAEQYPLLFTYEVKEELGYASEQLGEIFANMVEAIQMMDDQIFLELGIAKDMIAAARMAPLPGITTVIGRFDFAKTNKGWKMLEFNSDTPGGIVEAFYVNGKVCSYYGKQDPNFNLEDGITQAFEQIIKKYMGNVIRSKNFQKNRGSNKIPKAYL